VLTIKRKIQINKKEKKGNSKKPSNKPNMLKIRRKKQLKQRKKKHYKSKLKKKTKKAKKFQPSLTDQAIHQEAFILSPMFSSLKRYSHTAITKTARKTMKP